MKITTFQICDTTESEHLNGELVICEKKAGYGHALFIFNGKAKIIKMRDWVCENKKQIWVFKRLNYSDNSTRRGNNNGRLYNHYITYEVINKDRPGPTPGSGTAGNTGGN